MLNSNPYIAICKIYQLAILLIALLIKLNICFGLDDHVSKSNCYQIKHLNSQKINLNFQDISIKDLIYVLADSLNIDVVVSDSITGNVSVKLNNVTGCTALNFILDKNSLGYRFYDNVFYITTSADLLLLEKNTKENKLIAESYQPLHTEYVKLLNVFGENIHNLININSAHLLSERGQVFFDKDTNTIIVRDILANIKIIKDFIVNLDVPVKQVLIEIRIIKTGEDLKQALGIKYFNKNGANNYSLLEKDLVDFDSYVKLNLAKISNAIDLDIELQALEQENKIEILANPKLLTVDKHVAVIETGQEIPYITKSREGADPQVFFKKAVLRLEVTPFVTAKNEIALNLQVNKDQPGTQVSGISQAPIDTTQLSTKVIAKNKETIVLGGIFSDRSYETINKVPILGSIPVIGVFFTSKSVIKDKAETLIFVTPKLI